MNELRNDIHARFGEIPLLKFSFVLNLGGRRNIGAEVILKANPLE
jgi:hypothetical protein